MVFQVLTYVPQKHDNLHCQTELDNITGTCPAVLRWGLSSGEQNALDVQLKHPRDGNDVNTGVDPEFLIGPGGLFNDCFVEWGAIKIFKIGQYMIHRGVIFFGGGLIVLQCLVHTCRPSTCICGMPPRRSPRIWVGRVWVGCAFPGLSFVGEIC